MMAVIRSSTDAPYGSEARCARAGGDAHAQADLVRLCLGLPDFPLQRFVGVGERLSAKDSARPWQTFRAVEIFGGWDLDARRRMLAASRYQRRGGIVPEGPIVKRDSRTPIVTVIRRGIPSAPAGAPPEPSPPLGQPPERLAAPPPPPSSGPAVAAPPPAPSTHPSKRLRARLVARAAPHADAIRRLLDEARAANGGSWPRHVHVTIAQALGLPRSVVHAFLGTLHEGRAPP
jgi:hypothetical protein